VAVGKTNMVVGQWESLSIKGNVSVGDGPNDCVHLFDFEIFGVSSSLTVSTSHYSITTLKNLNSLLQ
jgi:hypothetical protein